ncbi:hypothetical protein [Dyella koreensis]|uniref:YXWGXW repeat-containing protein n=1 Tax=Dyella koreensis TaxID=311235 RepID=A0ABW8K6J6_9GAMM
MSTRLIALAALTLLASGCVEERVVHDRPVVVERPVVRREVVEEVVVAPQPPPPRVVEVEPMPRQGYVWARGYWRWNGREYVAIPGHWEVVRPGYHYVHPHYERRDDGWHLNVGVWVNG